MKKFFSADPIWQQGGLFLLRLVIGASLIYHGWEVFDRVKMVEYAHWDLFKNSSFGGFLPYAGKASELVAGLLFITGFLTRIAALLTIGTMLYITFIVGKGQIWYEDQYPFLFVLLAMVFFFCGPGALAVDRIVFNHRK